MSLEISNKPNTKSIESIMDKLEYKVGLITRNRGLESGIESSSVKGLAIGVIFGIVLLAIPIIIRLYQ
ncbi:tetrahydromethanopterin S-methyltransferase subunit F [Methanothermococcus okinawensis]|jgi:tetrahydromethanopterin S-methyltransferase subunit F|uniref:Tetrahydromethanopterin S-methyltransferase subunit F n=1 Tax=Methanothermococcus okinawensis (strain DSM 14208 / JCM 11175 / IH1) TaxID=647113 RepID=F8AMT7_METOI|nr:tetrahydromethanopterin S-methyltransferase subunit F [Methanothermococcus okinawensis]AEH06920.1 tetrahydromethanopterin S-methyltransferase, F subunit [Methanothermococcus okinawensis IH1]